MVDGRSCRLTGSVATTAPMKRSRPTNGCAFSRQRTRRGPAHGGRGPTPIRRTRHLHRVPVGLEQDAQHAATPFATNPKS
jgi:hypothetical protein